MPPSSTDPELRRDVEAVIRRAGAVALAAFRRSPHGRKADGSAITEADRACEAAIVDELSRRFPGDGIVGEEGAAVEARAGHARWFVDPIDGTGAFLDGLAHWGPTVCRVRDGRVDVGALFLPRLDEVWYAELGGGAFCGAARLPPSEPAPLDGLSSLYVPSSWHRDAYAAIASWPGKTRGLGSSAAHLALVASGAVSAAIVDRWQLWDVGAGLLMLSEVGCSVARLDGGRFDAIEDAGCPFVAGSAIAVAHLTRRVGAG